MSDTALPIQFAALPYKAEQGRLYILLLTSRETGRWVIPKGWPMSGRKPHRTAEQEAKEEAGIEGKVSKKTVGSYVYWKRLPTHAVLCNVEVHPLKVLHELDTWPEMHQRQRRWVSPQQAALMVEEPGLSTLILRFADRIGASAIADA